MENVPCKARTEQGSPEEGCQQAGNAESRHPWKSTGSTCPWKHKEMLKQEISWGLGLKAVSYHWKNHLQKLLCPPAELFHR